MPKILNMKSVKECMKNMGPPPPPPQAGSGDEDYDDSDTEAVKNTNGQNSGTSGQLKDRPGKR
jgi:hypothetical protein